MAPSPRARSDQGPASAVLSAGGTVLAATSGYAALLGRTPEALGGRSLDALFPEGPGTFGTARRIRAAVARAFGQGMGEAFEAAWPGLGKGGPRRWRIQVDPLKDAEGAVIQVLHTLEDVTELLGLRRGARRLVKRNATLELRCMAGLIRLREAQAELRRREAALARSLQAQRESESRLTAFLEYVPAAVAIKDPEGTCLYANDEMASLIENSAAQLRPLAVEVVATGRPVSRELRVSQGGRDRIHRVVKFPIRDGAGKVAAVGTLGTDVTRLKRAEMQLQALSARLGRSRRDLDRFVATLSHDLQEPLRKVMVFCDRALLRPSVQGDPEAREDLGRAMRAAGRLRAIYAGLAAYGALDQAPPDHGTVDLGEALTDALGPLEPAFRALGGAVNGGRLPVVLGDRRQLAEVFRRLLENALKFRHPGRPPFVQVRALQAGGRWRVEVEDNGQGFDPGDADRLFGAFPRLRRSEAGEGPGLGLAFCRRILEQHGGDISAAGRPGAGATFRLDFPVAVDSLSDQLLLASIHHPPPMWAFEPGTLRILDANTAALALYGYTREEFLDLRATDLCSEEDRARALDCLSHPLPAESWAWVSVHRTRTGRLEVAASLREILHRERPAWLATVLPLASPHGSGPVPEAGEGGQVHIAPDGRILAMDPWLRDAFGLPDPGERRLTLLDLHRWSRHPDGRPFPPGEFPSLRCLKTGEAQPPALIQVRPEGREPTWVVLRAEPVHHQEKGTLLGVRTTVQPVPEPAAAATCDP